MALRRGQTSQSPFTSPDGRVGEKSRGNLSARLGRKTKQRRPGSSANGARVDTGLEAGRALTEAGDRVPAVVRIDGREGIAGSVVLNYQVLKRLAKERRVAPQHGQSKEQPRSRKGRRLRGDAARAQVQAEDEKAKPGVVEIDEPDLRRQANSLAVRPDGVVCRPSRVAEGVRVERPLNQRTS